MAKNKRIVQIAHVKQCARLQCTAREAAAFLNIRVSTFNRLLQTDEKVRRAWEDGKQLGLMSLRRKQFRLAGENSAMAIHLGKQYLNQRDIKTLEHTGPNGDELNLSGLSKDKRDQLRQLLESGGTDKVSDSE